MSATTPPVSSVVRCPGCGAEIAFRIGASRVLICEFCSFAVARTEGGFEKIGKVADVIPTGTRLALQTRGTYRNVGFTLVGRIQLDWGQGRWDEWYAAFDNGRWGWLAEAAGHYYLSFRNDTATSPALAHPEQLTPGAAVDLPGTGRFVVSDRKRARYVAARGELPEVIPLDGTEYESFDLSGEHDRFVTLDYSDDPQRPTVYVGAEVPFESLGLDLSAAQPVEVQHQKGAALTCPNCRAPISLQAPDQAMRVTCGHCNALLDATQGNLRYLTLVQKAAFRYKLGSHATFFGVDYVVTGWLERGCVVEHQHYKWEEYLLYDAKNARFRFLVLSEGHWSFVTPIGAGDVKSAGKDAVYRGKTYRRFSSVEAKVERVHGEFYWEVAEGETATAIDYVAPPEGLSEECSKDEVNWSHAVYVSPAEIQKAFNDKAPLRSPHSVGAMQPNPVAYPFIKGVGMLSVAIAFAMFVLFHMYAGKTVVYESDLSEAAPEKPPELPDAGLGLADGGIADADASMAEQSVPAAAEEPAANAPYQSVVLFTEPFEISRGHRNLQVEFTSNVNQTWVGLDASLINTDTNELYSVELESSYYSDEDSTEDHRDQTAYLAELPAGSYLMRAELDWEKNQPRPWVHLTLTSGVVRFSHFVYAVLALLVLPFIARGRYRGFEASRWEDSTESA